MRNSSIPKISSLNKNGLLARTKELVEEERKITLSLIECLAEIELRQLHLEMGYPNLFAFCTKHLGLSDGSAYRRIQAMKLMKTEPSVKEKLESGELSLTNAAKIQSACQAAGIRKTAQEKPCQIQQTMSQSDVHQEAGVKEIIERCAGLSQKECDLKLFQMLPELKETKSFTEKERVLNDEQTEIRLIVSNQLKQKMEELMQLHSHQNAEQSYLKLFEKLVDEELKRKKREKGGTDNPVPDQTENFPAKCEAEKLSPAANQSRFIPKKLRQQVWSRAKGQCEYPGCGSRHFLEIDHRHPISLGGTNELINLRLLCRGHNNAEAVKKLGRERMQKFIPGIRR